MKKVNTLKQIKNDPRVDYIEKEPNDQTDTGYDYWCYLKPGWQVEGNEQHTIHEDTIKDVCKYLNHFVSEWPDGPALL